MCFYLLLFLQLVSFCVTGTTTETKKPIYEVSIRTIWEQVDSQANVFTRVNGKANYATEDAWASLKLSITKFASDTVLQIDNVLVGYRPIWDEYSDIYVEIGRAPLNTIFYSGLQFNAPFNGLHLGYRNKNLTFHGGLTIFGDYGEFWGAVAELVYVFDKLPLTFIHSYANWDKFNISQSTLKYLLGHIRNQPVIIYGSFLRNLSLKNHSCGWELGTSIGEIIEKRDVKVQVAFKRLGEKCIPAYDFPKMQGLQIKGIYSLSEKLALSGSLWFNKLGNVELGTHYVF